MSHPTEHLSCLQLDQYFANQAAPPRDQEAIRSEKQIEQHLKRCDQCARYLQNLHAVAADTALPGPLARPMAPTDLRPVATRRRRSAPVYTTLATGLAAAAAWWFAVQSGPQPYVGAKGDPTAQLLLQRGQQLHAWSGSEPLHPNDVLALRVACGPFVHLKLLSPGPPQQPVRVLAEMHCPASPQDPLPFTLQVDSDPGPEHLTVVYSLRPLNAKEVQQVYEDNTQSPQVWVSHFTLPKEIP